MDLLSYTDAQLTEVISRFKQLASIAPKLQVLTESCQSFGWSVLAADSLVIEFDTPYQSPFFVDLYNNDSVAGGFLALCILDWDDYNYSTLEAETERAGFDKRYFEIVSAAKNLLGEPDVTVVGAEPHNQCSFWRQEKAFILVLQGADDIEGLDIRLWLEYFDGNDNIPNSQVFEWLCQRHITKIEQSKS